jgi:hypothetical protein
VKNEISQYSAIIMFITNKVKTTGAYGKFPISLQLKLCSKYLQMAKQQALFALLRS